VEDEWRVADPNIDWRSQRISGRAKMKTIQPQIPKRNQRINNDTSVCAWKWMSEWIALLKIAEIRNDESTLNNPDATGDEHGRDDIHWTVSPTAHAGFFSSFQMHGQATSTNKHGGVGS
jgi:hypothetical protein